MGSIYEIYVPVYNIEFKYTYHAMQLKSIKFKHCLIKSGK